VNVGRSVRQCFHATDLSRRGACAGGVGGGEVAGEGAEGVVGEERVFTTEAQRARRKAGILVFTAEGRRARRRALREERDASRVQLLLLCLEWGGKWDPG